MLRQVLASLAVMVSAGVAAAGDIMVMDAYARGATPNAKAGAAFMVIMNHGATDDRLVAVRTDFAARAELHSHIEDANGVMSMVHVEEGFALPAGGMIELRRGGDHVMMMGVRAAFEQGGTIPMVLVFEQAGELELDVVIDLERAAGAAGHGAGHSHGHSQSHGSTD